MKIKNLLIVALLFFSASSIAQNVSFGLKAGLNVANLSSNLPDWNTDSRIGFTAGAGVKFSLGERAGLTIDVLYSQKGMKQTVNSTNVDYSSGYAVQYTLSGSETMTISYVEVPVLLRVKLGGPMYLTAGPYISFLAGYLDEATITFSSPGYPSQTTSESTSNHEGLTSSDFGGRFGLGAHLPLGVDISANYDLGFTNLIEETGGTNYKINTGTINFMVGYWFK